ncbi:hypothetical protein VTK56DRAFT_1351 [Thermocarpiscus australiensis]
MSQPHHSRTPFIRYPPSKVYRLIEPGPILLVTTGSPSSQSKSKSKPKKHNNLEDHDGDDINVMTMGFHMMLQHDSPPLIAACIGPWDATFSRLRATRECVLAVPSAEMARTAVDVGNCSADDDDDDDDTTAKNKFARFGLEALPADKVGAPLVGGRDVIANVECVVEDDSMVERYNLWVLRAVAAWVNERKRPGQGGRMLHHRGDGTFTVDGEVLDLKERMVKWKMFQD